MAGVDAQLDQNRQLREDWDAAIANCRKALKRTDRLPIAKGKDLRD